MPPGVEKEGVVDQEGGGARHAYIHALQELLCI